MSLVLVSLFLLAVTSLWLLMRRPKHPVDQLPGPPTIPLFGNVLSFLKPKEGVFAQVNKNARAFFPLYRTWMANTPLIHPLDPKYVETVLTSSQHITKSMDYNFLNDWLGTGLLVSGGSKWHQRRKLLTPTFHFKILEQFVPIFSDKTEILISKLRAHLNKPEGVDITPLVTRCALDIICQTAMGHAMNAQEDSDSKYVAAVYQINDLIVHRLLRPWLYPDWAFRLSPTGRKQRKLLGVLHGFTKKVIRERREELKNSKLEQNGISNEEDTAHGTKKKTAFLDLLIQASEEDGGLTDEDIREEVDTFMFEGHDTTAMAMSWGLYFVSAHPDVQDKCVSELSEIFGVSERAPTMSDLGSMKYLERVIKETLRLRPSVVTVARRLEHNLKLEGLEEFPPDTNVHINIFNIHRNPEIFPDPERFDPDRFLPEKCVDRHPYAYIPFSAGPRNCIGQKFAMLEMKSLLSTVLRNFHLESIDPEHHYQAVPDLILRPKNGLLTRITPRKTEAI